MAMSSMVMVQNALINALAKRALVIKGIFNDGSTTDFIAVVQFAGSQVLGNVDHHIYLLLMKHIQCLRLSFFAGPVHAGILHTVLGQELGRATGGISLYPFFCNIRAAFKVSAFCLALPVDSNTPFRECDIQRKAWLSGQHTRYQNRYSPPHR